MMQEWQLTVDEVAAIFDEYDRLCTKLGFGQVTLDAYVYDIDASPNVRTDHDTEVRSDTAGFSEKHNIIILPIDDREVLLRPITFPPRGWSKHDEDWPLWRIELWHEVVHQVSSHLGLYNPDEPGHLMADGTTWTVRGHGDGWFRAIERVASEFGVSSAQLEFLLISKIASRPGR